MKRVLALLSACLIWAAMGAAGIAGEAEAPDAEAGQWEPRVSRCATPEALGEPRLPEAVVLSAFAPGGSVACADGLTAYVDLNETNRVVTSRSLGYGVSKKTVLEAYEGGVSGVLAEGARLVCLSCGEDSGEAAIEFFHGDERINRILLQSGGAEISEETETWTPSMLRMDNGRILYADLLGRLFTCEMDGRDVRQVPGVTAREFAYYGGMVYFENPEDQRVYEGVYSEDAYDYVALSFPRLYRVNLDGSGLERLTDCGVRGLRAQGRYILYQNLDDAFVFPDAWMFSDFLSGVLYRFDAETGESRTLSIESDRYIPTPYGLAVWHHDFTIEPYDLERADLVLHDYDGTPRYRLRAGPREFFMDYAVVDGAIRFFGVDMSKIGAWYAEDMADFEAFSTVRLDGAEDPAAEPETVTIGGDRYSVYAVQLDLSDPSFTFTGRELRALTKLRNVETITVAGIGIEELPSLEGLTGVKSLDISGNDIEDISPLSALSGLEELDIERNGVADLSPLAGLTRLRNLCLTLCEAEDLSPLAGLSNLERLIADENDVASFAPLAGLRALRELDLSYTDCSDLAPLSGLVALRELRLEHNGVVDIAPLAGLTELASLNLYANNVTDLTPLYGLQNLKTLDLRGNKSLTREQVDALLEKLPELTVQSDFDES